MYRLAARVTVIASSFRRYLVTTKGVPSSKVSVIPNFVDTDFIRPLEKDNDFGRRHGLVDKFVVCHAGNVGWVYDLETLIEAAARLASFRDIVFLVVGDGVGRPVLERKASQRGVQNVRFLPFQPFEALPWMRAACDVHVALYRREQAWYSMPSKVYEIMASARPLLASAEPGTDVRTLVEETGCGLAVNPQDPDALVDAILRLYRDPATRAEMGRRGRAEAERAYSKDAVVAQYERLLRSVATRAD
jgi:colanic acid biosynthesis glycosyl transferase WcaI